MRYEIIILTILLLIWFSYFIYYIYKYEINWQCSKLGFHHWEEYKWKTGHYYDSGFKFSYKYMIQYKCKKCGKIENQN